MQITSTPSLYDAKKTLSRRERHSTGWLGKDGWVYKRQPKHLTDNEWHALQGLGFLLPRYVPVAFLMDIELIKMEYIEAEPITDEAYFMSHYEQVLKLMRYASLRHGDLTNHSVIPRQNKPILIDWSESRLWDDPRPDKRREGDRYWLKKTMVELCERRG